MEQNVTMSASTEVHQITTFADDTPTVSGAKLMPASSSAWKSFAEEKRNHGVLDILSRPVLLTTSNSVWSTSKNANSFPTEATANSVFSFPGAILDKSPNIVKKLEGFTYFRANVKVRVMVNAQAFSQGKLWIWFSPYELASGTQYASDTLACKTGYPGVELDVASGQPAEFTIPYCAPNSHYCLTSGEGTMGDLFLTVLSPLTISDASLSVFAWFEDIDLQLPTGVGLGDPPQPKFQIASTSGFELTIGTPSTLVSPGFWGGASLKGDGSNYVKISRPFLILAAVGTNFLMLPAGTRIKADVQPVEGFDPPQYSVKIITSTGIVGFPVQYSQTSDGVTEYFFNCLPGPCPLYGYTNEHKFDTETITTFNMINGASYSAAQATLPNVWSGINNQVTQTIDFLTSFAYEINFFGQNTKLKYVTSTGFPQIEYDGNNYNLSGKFERFDNSPGIPNKVTATADYTGNVFGKIFAQSSSSEEDDWYKNYPVAQMSESEHQAISSLVTSSLGKVISSATPMLAPLKTPLSWLSRLGTAVAAGYSKPTDVEKPHCMYNVPAKGFTHGEGPDNSVSLGVIPDNSLGLESNLFSTSIDELDVSYIAKKSCYLRTDAWTTTTTGRIFSFFVGPGICSYTNAGYNPTLLAYLTSIFRFWHGALRYRISVAKTGFHTGRLRISFHPGACRTDEVYNADLAYSWILDLSTSSEIDIEIPYVTTKPWLMTDLTDYTLVNPYGPTAGDTGPAITGSNNLNFFTGIIQVEVLNQLRNAGASSSTVDILTWISGGDSIEFAVPSFSNFRPVTDGAPVFAQSRFKRDLDIEEESLVVEVEEEEQEAEAPVEDVSDEMPEAQAFQTITDATSHTDQLDGKAFSEFFRSNSAFSNASTLTIGEKCSNLRVLLKRFAPFVYKNPCKSDLVDAARVIIDPAYFGVIYPRDTFYDGTIPIVSNADQTLGAYTNCQAPIEYISKIFRFFSGSRRYKCFSGNSNTGDSAIQQFGVRGYLETTFLINGDVKPPLIGRIYSDPYENFANSEGSFAHYVDGVNNKACEVSVPFYSQTPIQCISNGSTFPQADDYVMRYRVIFDACASAQDQAKAFVIYQAAGDDFNFGYLIGAPKLKKLHSAVSFYG